LRTPRINRVPSTGWRIRAGTLIAVGALGVHDLRYLIAYGGHAGDELSLQGHGYLRLATPLIAGILVLVAVAFASRLLRAYSHGEGETAAPPSTRRLWLSASAILISVYTCQEWIEGQLAAGHPGGVGAAFAHGGWVAVPLALALGLVIALLMRGAAAAVAVAVRRRARIRVAPSRRLLAIAVRSVWLPVSDGPLSRRLAPRAPPSSI
jgi:hypothetical protein